MIQIPISNYFKCKSSAPTIMNKDKNTRKLKDAGPLSSSTPKKKDSIMNENEVINLLSDDEEDLPSGYSERSMGSENLFPLLNVECVMSDSEMDTSFSSTKTIIYETPETPTKCQKTSKSSKSSYSPLKKRMVIRKTPVKRNLAKESFIHYPHVPYPDKEHEELKSVFKDIDDKTSFLHQIIYKYLHTTELRNLLDGTSQDLLSKSMQLDIPGMRLLCRLYWYKRRWYKLKKLAVIAEGKQTISSNRIQENLEQLIKQGFITLAERNNNLSFDEYEKLLTAKQCSEICKSLLLKCRVSGKKSAMKALSIYCRGKPIYKYFNVGGANGHSSNCDRVLKLMRDKVGPCYRLSDIASETLDKLYLLMYLGMDYTIIREKKLELMLINDKNRTETYPIDKSMNMDNASTVFNTQEEFERYFEAHNIYENLLKQTDPRKKSDIIQDVYEKYKSLAVEETKDYKALPVWLRRFTPAYLYIKIIEKGVEDMKRQEKYQIAVDMLTTLTGQNTFRHHKIGEWYAEKALILHRYIQEYDMAGKTLLQGLQSDIPKALKLALQCRAKQLVNQKNITLEESIREQLSSTLEKEPPITETEFTADHIYKQHMDCEGKGKRKFKTRTENGATVQAAEDYCLTHYIESGQFTDGRHWEGNMITTIFTLLFWDIIYMKLRGYSGIFLTAYQMYPLDMFCSSFYENRKAIIEERLSWIENSTTDVLREEMRKVWDSRPESELSGINRGVGWERVCEVCECAGARRLARVCRRLATDYGYARSGFPDLTLWNTNTKQIKFVEVKTDTDKPSIKQLQWMRYLKSVGIDTGFCYVGVNTERNKARYKRNDQEGTKNVIYSEY
ncbi:hypothetical protein K1T71_010342 [Dendrolimus kikuchii]|uniref:Uncharacterized protein n=1 Tax=Dendrolimus kikuchii TaxID=765133 RepID=A0ACC1CRB1_9NEOP|nr:hypothetical protein K1T71_010342 [Dendrolimus kikuchii]